MFRSLVPDPSINSLLFIRREHLDIIGLPRTQRIPGNMDIFVDIPASGLAFVRSDVARAVRPAFHPGIQPVQFAFFLLAVFDGQAGLDSLTDFHNVGFTVITIVDTRTLPPSTAAKNFFKFVVRLL